MPRHGHDLHRARLPRQPRLARPYRRLPRLSAARSPPEPAQPGSNPGRLARQRRHHHASRSRPEPDAQRHPPGPRHHLKHHADDRHQGPVAAIRRHPDPLLRRRQQHGPGRQDRRSRFPPAAAGSLRCLDRSGARRRRPRQCFARRLQRYHGRCAQARRADHPPYQAADRRQSESQLKPAAAMTQTVGQYEIRDLLGEGGIGQVHAAFDTVLQREVAMKSLRPELLSDANFVDRFRAEATSLARLNHPNITTLYSLIPDGKNLYMVMELVRGHTLDDILAKRNAPLDVRESLAIISQAADGLAYAHSMGVIHRDIKPSNLMVAENGVLKIMDFGIARVRGTQRLTRSGSIVGTLAYMAPEQLRGEEGDEACDLYSLAIVLYEMLTGTPPFSATSEYDLMQAQINQKPDRLIPRVPGLDSRIEAAIMRALAKKPDQRFASTRAFSDALGASAMRMDAPKILHNDTRLIETPANPIQIAPARRSVFDKLPNIPGLAPELRAAVYGGGAAAVVALAVIGILSFHSSSPPVAVVIAKPAVTPPPVIPAALPPQTPKAPPSPSVAPVSPPSPSDAAALSGPLATVVAAANRGDPAAQNQLGVK